MHTWDRSTCGTESPYTTEQAACADFVRGNKDPAKMTYAKMRPGRQAGTHTMTVSKGGRCCSHGYGAHDARKGMTVKGSKRQAYPLVASVTELMVGLCKRESNQPRPGVAPGCPQHEAEGSTWCLRGSECMRSEQRVAQVFLYGKVQTPSQCPR